MARVVADVVVPGNQHGVLRNADNGLTEPRELGDVGFQGRT